MNTHDVFTLAFNLGVAAGGRSMLLNMALMFAMLAVGFGSLALACLSYQTGWHAFLRGPFRPRFRSPPQPVPVASLRPGQIERILGAIRRGEL